MRRICSGSPKRPFPSREIMNGRDERHQVVNKVESTESTETAPVETADICGEIVHAIYNRKVSEYPAIQMAG